MSGKSIQHFNPVWREKANFIIGMIIPPLKNKPQKAIWEQLWARKINDFHFEICCIPFFSYGLSLGDVVETSSNYMVIRVSQKSGHDTIRIWFTEQATDEQIREVNQKIMNIGCLTEIYSYHLLGVDADSQSKTHSLIGMLEGCQEDGLLVYEIGNS